MSDESGEERYEEHGQYGKEGEGEQMGGYHVKKRSLWLMAGGALGALAAIGIGKASKKVRPAVVGAVKEGYAFKEWAAAKLESCKEDAEDIVAEARHAYYKDLEASAASIEKEKDLLKKAEESVARKRARAKTAKEGE